MKKTCAECGASMMKYRHTLTKPLTDGLYIAFRAGGHRAQRPLALENLNLTRNQWDNFQKLRYWGLVEKTFDLFGHRIQGHWHVTKLGADFIQHGIAIPNVVVTYRGDVLHFDGKPVTFAEKAPLYYQQQVEFARDAEPMP